MRGLPSLTAPLLALGLAWPVGRPATDTAVRYVANAGLATTC